jgi:hypothetical protein
MTLGTADGDGRPWVSPVYYAPEGYAEFYWVSSPKATHSRNIAARLEVSIVIFDSRTPIGSGQGVYVSACAGVDGRRARKEHRHLLSPVRSARGGRVERGGRALARSPSARPGYGVGALRTRPAGPADAGERIGRVLEDSIHRSAWNMNSAIFAGTEF